LINFGALYFLMHRETKVLETRQMIGTLAKLLVSSAILAGVCWAGNRWVFATWTEMSLLTRIATLALVITVGAGSFFGSAMLLRVGELDDVTKLLRRKLRLG
jgi:peptidoglycan biosynthesis protein MviN/MurJ (putative lipid II flippase)